MTNLVHSFDTDGRYLHSSERFIDPVTKKPAMINRLSATDTPLPSYDPKTEIPYFVNGKWEVRESNHYQRFLEKQLLLAKSSKKELITRQRHTMEERGILFHDVYIPLTRSFLREVDICLSHPDIDTKEFSLKCKDVWRSFNGQDLKIMKNIIVKKIVYFNELQRKYEEMIDSMTDIESIKNLDIMKCFT